MTIADKKNIVIDMYVNGMIDDTIFHEWMNNLIEQKKASGCRSV